MTINIEFEAGDQDFFAGQDKPYGELIETVILAALDFVKCPYDAEVNVILTDDTGIQEINKLHRGIDKATDVLSFPMADYLEPAEFDRLEESVSDYFNPETGELLLGDIILSVDRVKEQAGAYGHTVTRELAFLTVHSMLHLFGYDHMEEDERLLMEAKQEDILSNLGISR